MAENNTTASKDLIEDKDKTTLSVYRANLAIDAAECRIAPR